MLNESFHLFADQISSDFAIAVLLVGRIELVPFRCDSLEFVVNSTRWIYYTFLELS